MSFHQLNPSTPTTFFGKGDGANEGSWTMARERPASVALKGLMPDKAKSLSGQTGQMG